MYVVLKYVVKGFIDLFWFEMEVDYLLVFVMLIKLVVIDMMFVMYVKNYMNVEVKLLLLIYDFDLVVDVILFVVVYLCCMLFVGGVVKFMLVSVYYVLCLFDCVVVMLFLCG